MIPKQETEIERATDAQLTEYIENKQKVLALMNDPFVNKYIIAALEEKLTKIHEALCWQPGSDLTAEQIALDRVWKSGIMFGISEFWNVCNAIKNKGEDAEKEMGVREQKK